MSFAPAIISQTQTVDNSFDEDIWEEEISFDPNVEEEVIIAEGTTITGLNQPNAPPLNQGDLTSEVKMTKKYIQLTLDGRPVTTSTRMIVVKKHMRANSRKGSVSLKGKLEKCVLKRKSSICKLSLHIKKLSRNEDRQRKIKNADSLSARLACKLHIEELTNLFDSIKTK